MFPTAVFQDWRANSPNFFPNVKKAGISRYRMSILCTASDKLPGGTMVLRFEMLRTF